MQMKLACSATMLALVWSIPQARGYVTSGGDDCYGSTTCRFDNKHGSLRYDDATDTIFDIDGANPEAMRAAHSYSKLLEYQGYKLNLDDTPAVESGNIYDWTKSYYKEAEDDEGNFKQQAFAAAWPTRPRRSAPSHLCMLNLWAESPREYYAEDLCKARDCSVTEFSCTCVTEEEAWDRKIKKTSWRLQKAGWVFYGIVVLLAILSVIMEQAKKDRNDSATSNRYRAKCSVRWLTLVILLILVFPLLLNAYLRKEYGEYWSGCGDEAHPSFPIYPPGYWPPVVPESSSSTFASDVVASEDQYSATKADDAAPAGDAGDYEYDGAIHDFDDDNEFDPRYDPYGHHVTVVHVLWGTLLLIFMVYLVTDVRYCVLNQRARARSSKMQGLVNRFGPGLPNALALESGADWDRAFENECRTHAKRLADAGPITIVSIGGDSFPIQWPDADRFRALRSQPLDLAALASAQHPSTFAGGFTLMNQSDAAPMMVLPVAVEAQVAKGLMHPPALSVVFGMPGSAPAAPPAQKSGVWWRSPWTWKDCQGPNPNNPQIELYHEQPARLDSAKVAAEYSVSRADARAMIDGGIVGAPHERVRGASSSV